jgi:hypothetical protein
MTYARLEHIEIIAGRLEAERIAARITALNRLKVERLAKKIDERKKRDATPT